MNFLAALRKDSPAVGDVHVSSTGGKRPKKAKPFKAMLGEISQETKLPITGLDLAGMQEEDQAGPAKRLADLFDKAGARHSKSDIQLLQTVHDHVCALGAKCPTQDDLEDEPSVAKRDADWSIPFTVAKADPDQQLIFGWASVVEENGQLVVDKQNDVILPDDLEKAAYDFVLNSRKHGEMHDKVGTGHLVESMVFTAEKQAALGIDLGKVAWWVGFHVDDADTWKAHKAGKLPEFSIGGRGRRVAL